MTWTPGVIPTTGDPVMDALVDRIAAAKTSSDLAVARDVARRALRMEQPWLQRVPVDPRFVGSDHLAAGDWMRRRRAQLVGGAS